MDNQWNQETPAGERDQRQGDLISRAPPLRFAVGARPCCHAAQLSLY
jgi:hypothetical protein